jgi:hypothetical protein
MDSILIFEIDRIYWIIWIFFTPGFQMKPGIGNPLRGKTDRQCQGPVAIRYLLENHGIRDFPHEVANFPPEGGCNFHGFIRKP